MVRLGLGAVFFISKFATLCCLLTSRRHRRSDPQDVLPAFDAFRVQHGRQYLSKSSEYLQRQALYEKRLSLARQQNGCPSRRWTAGANRLWDWTEDELSQLSSARTGNSQGHFGWGNESQVLPCRGRNHMSGQHVLTNSTDKKGKDFPSKASWKHLIKSSEILQLGHCGSCWAIASAKLLEVHAKIHGKDRSFSAQQLVSCVPNLDKCGGTGGCGGATMALAMDWVMAHGCAQEHEIPYLATDAKGVCPSEVNLKADGPNAFGMIGWTKLPENSYESLMQAVAREGPVGVSVASGAWLYYDNGIFDSCGKNAIIDHAVVLVGYGHDPVSLDAYWLLLNSWGLDWGEQGYLRLLRHDEKTQWCGIDSRPEVGTGCPGGPQWVTVCGMCGILYNQVLPNFKSAKKMQHSPQSAGQGPPTADPDPAVPIL